ncbi:MAG: hypothetical protein ACKN9T_02900 [Candidatus Methylumidiphilus sp.]
MTDHATRTRHRAIHLPCILAAGYHFFRGNTCELSEEEAAVQIPSLAYPGVKSPAHGVAAVLTLGLGRGGGAMREILKIPCKVTYIATTVVGLQLYTQDLDERQQKIFDAVLKVKV